LFHNIVSLSNLLHAWEEFKRGKSKKKDVALFELNLEDNIFELHRSLVSKAYQHTEYEAFYISDPKLRNIHKASVRDRVVHQAVYRILCQIFDKHFIYDSYSSRKSRGTHLGVRRSYKACRKVSKNWRRKIYILKCDVRKFFDSMDHSILRVLIEKKVLCLETMRLVDLVLESFKKETGKGLPLGNVTSQLFANIYLDQFDQFVKHGLKMRYYFRYCDDFIIISENKQFLSELVDKIKIFLDQNLLLKLHPDKVEIRSMRQGIDFLGYVCLPNMIVLRTKTKKRIIKKIKIMFGKLKAGEISLTTFKNTLMSYLGVVSHCCSREIEFYIKRFL